MKVLVFLFLSFCSIPCFAQSTEAVVEEKTSDWITIDIPKPVQRTVTTTERPVRRTTPAATKPPAETKPPSAFKKTNKKVGRFKKDN